jgi:hypothetical protein
MKPNRKHIQFIAAPQGSPEWLALRDNGIGGSEIGGVLGIADYMDPIKVFLSKIGEDVGTFEGNRFSRFGHLMEPIIADLYQYWEVEGGCDTMLINKEKKNRLRRVQRVNGYIKNEKYPWLFASLDRRIMGDSRGRGILETKNTTTMEKDRYTYGFNRSFYCQVQQYLLIDEADFADVAIYYDGNNYEVRPVEPDKDVQQLIIEESREFWLKVEKAREIKKAFKIDKYYGNHMDFIPVEHREGVGMLMGLEPELTGSESEHEFIRALVKPTKEFTQRDGKADELTRVKRYHKLGELGKKIKAHRDAVQAQLIVDLGGYHQANFGDAGYFSYKPQENGSSRFHVSPKLFKE